MPVEGNVPLPVGCARPGLHAVGETLQPELHEEETVSRTGESFVLPAQHTGVF